jgi:GTP:adenosylcobinamide-phosphate guanylyltransferase
MDAILLAGGGANPDDPLYALSGGKPKALLPIAGKPMAQWVLDALAGASLVGGVLIIGLDAGCGLDYPGQVRFAPDAGSLLGNVRLGLEMSAAAETGSDRAGSGKVLLVSADIPAIQPAMVDWVVRSALEAPADLCYCAIDRAVMEARYPGSGRSYIRFRDREVCGGDLTVVDTGILAGGNQIWQRLVDGRKSALRMAMAVGIDVLLLLLFRRLGIDDLVQVAQARLGISGRVLNSPYAELGMDVDKPYQFELVERGLPGCIGSGNHAGNHATSGLHDQEQS